MARDTPYYRNELRSVTGDGRPASMNHWCPDEQTNRQTTRGGERNCFVAIGHGPARG